MTMKYKGKAKRCSDGNRLMELSLIHFCYPEYVKVAKKDQLNYNGAHCTYPEHLMHEISDLRQGFIISQVTNNVEYICMQYFFTIL